MISGGSKGIGLATARRLGKKGAKISICARNEEPLREAERILQDEEIDVFGVRADVSNEEEVENWFQQTESRLGQPTVLINNAGVSGKGNFLDLTEEQWDRTYGVNCRGVFLCTRRVLPGMIEARRGRILMISSMASLYFTSGNSLYFSSKWALNGFAHCLAKEVSRYNIHVHIICPGMTETEFFEDHGGRPHEKDVIYASPDDIAQLVERFLELPDHLDALEYTLFPSWQLPAFGVRR